MLNLIFDPIPIRSVRKGFLLLCDLGPKPRKFLVYEQELLLVGREFILFVDCIDRTRRDACVAINALSRVNDEEVRSFIKTLNRAN
jgi:hypothetical protein